MRPGLTLLVVLTCIPAGIPQTALAPYSIGVELMQPAGCPVFITAVLPQSPAERAGLRPGDRVLRVDGDKVHSNDDAARLLRGTDPDKIRVRIRRDGKDFQTAIVRENIADIFARSGKRVVSGVVVPASFSGTWIAARVFPNGFPLDITIFYPGFEVLVVPDAGRSTINGLVIRGKWEVMAGAVPAQGPAARAGLQSGDVITAVNGVPMSGQSAGQLYDLFSSHGDGALHLALRRGSAELAIDVELETAPRVAAENGRRMINGVAVPLWLADGSAGCHPG